MNLLRPELTPNLVFRQTLSVLSPDFWQGNSSTYFNVFGNTKVQYSGLLATRFAGRTGVMSSGKFLVVRVVNNRLRNAESPLGLRDVQDVPFRGQTC